jgi:ubiquinone/menaquinone biosynthesis C-methylase UbiE
MRPELQRRVQRYGWDYSSSHYEAGWQHQLWPAQKRLIEKADLKKSEKILDVSCGTGLVTFPVAETVSPEGSVTGIDLSECMIEKAAEEAKKKGLSNITFKRMDAEELDLSGESFDVALNSLGLMYYPDPVKAIREMYRVVKPEGRAAALVWGRRNKCGWTDIFPIVDRRVESDVCPLFFQLGTGKTLQETFENAGFKDVDSDRFKMKLHFDSDEQAVIAAFLGGAVALAYRKFDEQTKEEAHEEYLESIESFSNGSGYDIPGEFVIVSGKKTG